MINVAKTAGFCYGVKRAVDDVYKEIENGKKIATLGPLIHNRQVIEDLASKGVYAYDSIEDIPSDHTVVIRAHGVPKAVYDKMNGREYIDLTCPFVAKIHKIVSKHHKEGYQIIIVGDKNHPEVIGINGWCDNKAVIINDVKSEIDGNLASKDICIVAQTTINRDFFGEIVQNVKKTCKSTLVFDTICSATSERQKSAAELAARVDMMFVVGGKNSSNTLKLYEVCKELCENTVHVENSKIIKKQYNNLLNKKMKVGITAGASTPESVIKEVYLTMAENEMNFAEALEETLKPLKSGEVVKGVVIGITPTEVQVDIGSKYDGVIPFDELTNDPNDNINDLVKIGEEVDVYIVHVSDRDGVVTLSKKKIDAVKGMEELKAAFENNEVLSGRVVELVRGGVVTIAKGVRVFIPASECALNYLSDLGVLLNTEQKFRIIKMDTDRRGRQRVVGSIKTVAKEAADKASAEFWATAEEGKQYKGIVKSLTSFGAFVSSTVSVPSGRTALPSCI